VSYQRWTTLVLRYFAADGFSNALTRLRYCDPDKMSYGRSRLETYVGYWPKLTSRRITHDVEITKVMGDAFDAACKATHEQPPLVKEILAKRIIEAASKGERNPDRLCAKALDAIGANSRFS